MGKTRITDKILIDIATDIGNKKDVMKLAVNLGLSADDATMELDCCKILRKAMNATAIEDQSDRLRDALIKSGHTAAADIHLNSRPKAKLTLSQQRKRQINGTTPTPKKPDGWSRLEEEKQKMKMAEEELKDLQKQEREVQNQIDQKRRKVKKIKGLVVKLLEQNYEDDAKKLAKQREELDKFKSSEPFSTPQAVLIPNSVPQVNSGIRPFSFGSNRPPPKYGY